MVKKHLNYHMLNRKIYKNLVDCKNTPYKKALLIRGPRQVGKTYIIHEFGKAKYESFIELNFITNSNLKHNFDVNIGFDGVKYTMPFYMGMFL